MSKRHDGDFSIPGPGAAQRKRRRSDGGRAETREHVGREGVGVGRVENLGVQRVVFRRKPGREDPMKGRVREGGIGFERRREPDGVSGGGAVVEAEVILVVAGGVQRVEVVVGAAQRRGQSARRSKSAAPR